MMAGRSILVLFLGCASACSGPSGASDPLEAVDAAPPRPPDAPSGPPATAFRFTSLRLADPHIWAQVGVCLDLTETVNTVATNVLQVDASKPPDGLLDGSLALVFRPFDPEPGAELPVDLEVPVCTAPAGSSTCSATAATPRYAMTATVQAQGECLDLLPGSTSYHPPDVPAAPCFGTAARTIGLHFLGADITLADARGAASYAGDRLDAGLIRGFLSLADARAITIDIPGVVTAPLASFLHGGGSCHDSGDDPDGDMDVGPDGQKGWYVYVTFTAARAPYSER